MSMNTLDTFLGGSCGGANAMLVRLTALAGGNRYTAKAVEFGASGTTQIASPELLEVTNLAEPSDAAGKLAPGADVVAVDVEGRWVTFVQSGGGAGATAARVTAALGGAAYRVREQVMNAAGQLVDKPGAADITAINLAELSLGPGGAVDAGTVVLITSVPAQGSSAAAYVFDHPTYAKYLT